MNTRFGDMAELVECARLEIAYTGNCIEGSNPPISATNFRYCARSAQLKKIDNIFSHFLFSFLIYNTHYERFL